jgi:hypothetical protein
VQRILFDRDERAAMALPTRSFPFLECTQEFTSGVDAKHSVGTWRMRVATDMLRASFARFGVKRGSRNHLQKWPVGIVLQRRAEAVDPRADELNRVCTVANIIRYITSTDETHIVCQGVQRARQSLKNWWHRNARPEPSTNR